MNRNLSLLTLVLALIAVGMAFPPGLWPSCQADRAF
jgi:hypothetical protein